MTPDPDYLDFLKAKVPVPSSDGIEVDPAAVNPLLRPHIRAVVPWLLRGGRRALFARFGMQKTTAHLECLRLIMKQVPGPTLIGLPLGARLSFFKDAETWFKDEHAIRLNFIRSDAEIDPAAINMTNFESIREGKVDPRRFTAGSLDEGDILRGFGGTKTFREFMRVFEGVRYRFVATATPDPNDFIELLAYSAFLGVMDVGQAKTRFFKRDSEQADRLTIHPHKVREFWLWVASWALFLQRPSDLGPEFSDEGYDLPALDVRWHEIPTDHSGAGAERDGQNRMFRNATAGMVEASREKRDSLAVRIAKMAEIIRQGGDGQEQGSGAPVQSSPPCREQGEAQRSQPGEAPQEQAPDRSGGEAPLQQAISVDAPEEGSGSRRESREESAAAGTVSVGSGVSRDHEEARPRSQGEEPESEAAGTSQGELRDHAGTVRRPSRKPGRRVLDLRSEGRDHGEGEDAAAISGPLPPYQEGARDTLPSLQLRPGALQGQPRSPSAGADLSRQQWVIWCDLNDEQRQIERTLAAAGLTYASVDGSMPLDAREALLGEWWDRKREALVSKPVMLGAGLNLQQCNRAVFAGIGFKFKDFIQAVHRIYRYGQQNNARIDLIYTEAEREVRRALEDKWAKYEIQSGIMAGIIKEYGLARSALAGMLGRSIGIERQERSGEAWTVVNNDCVAETAAMTSDSVHLIVTSIPFATQYEYSPSYNDFGHTDDNAHFWRQMDFLTPNLLRVLEPGRIAAIHVKDRIVPSGMTGLGFQTVAPFHAETIDHFRKHGFGYMGMKTVTTDVVRENNQTYRLGWTEQCKDGTKMGCGMPEYILLFRKPPTDRTNGYADRPVVKDKPLCDDHGEPAPFDSKTNWKQPVAGTGYSRGRWQLDAHGFQRSGGNRLLSSAELASLEHHELYKLWRDRSTGQVYDFEAHVAAAEEMDHGQRLPATFMLLPPHSWHPDVWSDVTRMRTLNGAQHAAGREMHLCPLQFDIVDRLVAQLTMEGETVFDPFGGLMTVPLRAVRLKRRGCGVELNPGYFRDGVHFLEAQDAEMAIPTLFDLLEGEAA